jgi:excisionase family DNA binding protein
MSHLKVSEASRRIPAVSEATIRGMLRRGELTEHRVGHRVLIPESELVRVFGILYHP